MTDGNVHEKIAKLLSSSWDTSVAVVAIVLSRYLKLKISHDVQNKRLSLCLLILFVN